MSDEMNKYPNLKTIFLGRWKNNIIVKKANDEFQSLLAARQRDEEIIRGLVEVMERLLCDLEIRDDFNEIYQQVNAAELRLKEGDNE